MITRVIGKANGFDIIFTHIQGARWETTVPSNLSGEYVVEIFAENDSGNSAYVCKMLFIILENGYLGEIQTNQMTSQVSIGEFLANVLENGMSASPEKTEYTVIPRGRGYTIDQAVCSRDAY